ANAVVHLDVVLQHMAEDQQVEHGREHRGGHGLETHLPETQDFLVEQCAPARHAAALSRGRLGTRASQPSGAWPAMTLRNTSSRSARRISMSCTSTPAWRSSARKCSTSCASCATIC